MARVIVDFSEAADFSPVPAGIYRATIDARNADEIQYGKEKGTPYVRYDFVINFPEEFAGRVIMSNFMIAGKGAGRLRKLLKDLEMYDDADGSQFNFDTKSLHGIEVDIRVSVRTTDRGESNEIVAVMPVAA